MQKVIGTFKLKNKTPKSVKTVVKNYPLALKMNSGWNVQKFLKLNIDELLATYSNRADSYTIGWSDNELSIHFFNGEDSVQFGCIKKVLPKGMDFYQAHAGKDMFLGAIIDVLYKTPNYTENFLEDSEDVDAESEGPSSKKGNVSKDTGKVLRSEPTDHSIN